MNIRLYLRFVCKRTDLQITSFQYVIPFIHIVYRVHSKRIEWVAWARVFVTACDWENSFLNLNFITENRKNRLACRHNGDDRLSLLPANKTNQEQRNIYILNNMYNTYIYRAPNLFISCALNSFSNKLFTAIAKCNICHILDSYFTIIFVSVLAFILSNIGFSTECLPFSHAHRNH